MSKKPGKTKNINIAVTGALGKMGVEILALSGDAGCTVTESITVSGDWKNADPKNIDCVIEFSSPDGLMEAIDWCVKNKKPLVSGTTGLDDADRTALEKASKKIPLLYSANMSPGVAVLNAMIEAFAGVSDWDYQINEAHHAQKKDKPSGTALLLQDKLEEVLGRNLPEPLSIRGGSVAGIHEVWAMGQDETIVLQHTASNRRVFARGALKAARWLFDKKQPGLYDLTQLYKVR